MIRPDKYSEGARLLIDKPVGWTSFDVVNKIRNTLRHHCGHRIRVGHSGTLDPLASGLLIICTGKATKTMVELHGLDKKYLATITLGEQTPSHDRETEVTIKKDCSHLSKEEIGNAVQQLTGRYLQMPPIFSAKKKDGKVAYKLARKGIVPDLKPSEIEIFSARMIAFDKCKISVDIHCSKGTYIRSFARDIGDKLGSGAVLDGLCRTAIGKFRIENALTIESFVKQVKKEFAI